MLQRAQLPTSPHTLYSSTYCNDRYQYKRNRTFSQIPQNHSSPTMPPQPFLPRRLSIFSRLSLNRQKKSSRPSKELIQMRHLKPTQSTSVTMLTTNFIWNLALQSWSGMVKTHPNWSYLTNSMSDQDQEYTNNSSVTCIHKYLSSYWREFKNHDIKSYIDSYTTKT